MKTINLANQINKPYKSFYNNFFSNISKNKSVKKFPRAFINGNNFFTFTTAIFYILIFAFISALSMPGVYTNINL